MGTPFARPHIAARTSPAPGPRHAARFSYIRPHGEIIDAAVRLPDVPDLIRACAAVARGTLIATETGPVAVEDLLPGDQITTRDNDLQTLRWIGATSVNYRCEHMSSDGGSLRIMAHAMSDRAPNTDLLLHHSARVLMRHPVCAMQYGAPSALVPARSLVDCENIIQVRPIGSVEFFNLAFDSHQIIYANGLEIESYHPGAISYTALGGELHHHLAHLFPYLNGKLEQFGALARPRISEDDVAALGLV